MLLGGAGMWRFILVTFGFLGFSFYELSGGAHYAPVDHSIQARALMDEPRSPVQENADETPSRFASVDELRTTRLEKLDTTADERFNVTLASANGDNFRTESVRPAATGEEKVALLTASAGDDAVSDAVTQALTDTSATATADAEKIWPGAIELFSQRQSQPSQEQRRAPTGTDIRYVTGNVVNMRDGPGTTYARITSLTDGTEVAVLDRTDDGWLMLRVTQTGEEGWMADWLVSAPAN